MYPDHRSISEETVSYTLDAESLFNEFTEDSQQAELKYLDQTIIVSGVSNLYKREIALQLVIKFTVNLRL